MEKWWKEHIQRKETDPIVEEGQNLLDHERLKTKTDGSRLLTYTGFLDIQEFKKVVSFPMILLK